MKKKILYFVFYLFFVFCLLIPFYSPKAITVGPVKLEYTADPGQILEGEIFLINEEKSKATFYPVFEGFYEDNGERKFLPEAVDLAKWFKIEDKIELDAGEQITIPFKIEIPKDAGPGGHYAIMWWSTAPADYSSKPNQNVAVVTRAGILVYLRVSGDVKEKGDIVSFGAENKKHLFNSLPINFVFTFKNEGDVHLKPQGNIIVKSLFGKKKADLKINQYEVQVFPKTEKDFGVKWESGSIFGVFKAELKVDFGEEGKNAAKTAWVIIFPWKLGIVIALILIFLIFLLPYLVRKYNNWVIRKAGAKDFINTFNNKPDERDNEENNEEKNAVYLSLENPEGKNGKIKKKNDPIKNKAGKKAVKKRANIGSRKASKGRKSKS